MKTFLAKNLYLTHLRRFRLAGVLYLLFLLVYVPYSAFTSIADLRWSPTPFWDAASTLASVIDVRIEPFTVAAAALLMTLLVFGYLFTARSANMIHSLPANRASLFRSGVLAALTLMWVPQLITAAVCLIPVAVSHTGMIWLAGWWFLATALMSVFFVGLAAICVMFAGRPGAAILFYVILNFVYAGIRFVANALGETFVLGLTGTTMAFRPYFMTPLVWLVRVGVSHTDLVRPEPLPASPSELMGWFRPDGAGRVLITAAVGVVFCLLAYAVYRRRRIETAGSFLTVEWMKPVFKIGVSAGIALLASCFAVSIERQAGILRGSGTMFAAMVLQTLVIGLLVWFIAEMMIRRSVRVFTKRQWLVWSIYSVCVVVLLILLRVDAFGIERRVPDTGRLLSASMRVYGEELQTDDPEEICGIHRLLLEGREEIREYEDLSYDAVWDDSTVPVQFTYVMENGSLMMRSYTLSRNGGFGARTLEEIDEMVNRPENAGRMLLGEYADEYVLTRAEITVFTLNPGDDTDGSPWYEPVYVDLRLSAADREDLIAAIRQDIAEGHFHVGDPRPDDYANTLELDLADPENPDLNNGFFDYRSLELSPACTHTLDVILRSPGLDRSDLITHREIAEVENWAGLQ